jgi:hypothetical protein
VACLPLRRRAAENRGLFFPSFPRSCTRSSQPFPRPHPRSPTRLGKDLEKKRLTCVRVNVKQDHVLPQIPVQCHSDIKTMTSPLPHSSYFCIQHAQTCRFFSILRPLFAHLAYESTRPVLHLHPSWLFHRNGISSLSASSLPLVHSSSDMTSASLQKLSQVPISPQSSSPMTFRAVWWSPCSLPGLFLELLSPDQVATFWVGD